ncbi:MAG: hypothetical protein DYG94_01490 [Leptolyngbya sp. PLA3]|nr:MAG: hypothetical protein EDM82_00395 [Cyanobacteria bacterium CYA]MCE7967404.1 hypothetical protein [Leptolyngbya sp. PL-A3]
MKTIAFVSLTAIAAAVVSADTVQMQFGGVSRGSNVSIRVNGGSSHNVFAGSVIHNIDTIRTVTYCIDPDQWASTGTNVFEQTALEVALSHRSFNADKADAIARIAKVAGQDIWSETVATDLASAFQLAVWEVVLDYNPGAGAGSLDLGLGNFKAAGVNGSSLSGSISGLVAHLFSGMQSATGNPNNFVAYTNRSHQDFMTQIPAPGAAALALMGLPLLATRKR